MNADQWKAKIIEAWYGVGDPAPLDVLCGELAELEGVARAVMFPPPAVDREDDDEG